MPAESPKIEQKHSDLRKSDPQKVEKTDPSLLLKTLTSALLWIGLNLSLAMTNKWLFQYKVSEKTNLFILIIIIFYRILSIQYL